MGRKKKSSSKAKSKKKPALTAANADKFELYERSVQDPPTDVHFMQRVFRKERGMAPTSLREDFCGTAMLCAAWVKDKPERTALGVDLHGPTLRYGKKKHLDPLGDDSERVQLLQQNVLEPVTPKVDAVAAFNFSYCTFKTRQDLLTYATNVYQGLKPGGAFFLDIHGGTESFVEVEESTKHKGFTYVWDQCPYDAINGFGKRYIHFRFPDGTELHRAFSYDWRVWTLPEVRDILLDAGFSRVDVYWEGADENGDGNGIFRRTKRAENEESWVAYMVAWRDDAASRAKEQAA